MERYAEVMNESAETVNIGDTVDKQLNMTVAGEEVNGHRCAE